MTARQRALSVCVLVVTLMFCVADARSQAPSAPLAGLVTNTYDVPVRGATVRIIDRATGAEVKVLTDASGSYQAILPSRAQYRLSVEVAGFNATTVEVGELRGDMNRVDVRLREAPGTWAPARARPPLLNAHLKAAASEAPKDCGHHSLGDSAQAAQMLIDCVEEAQRSRRSYMASFWQPGTDSTVIHGLVSPKPGEALFVSYDGDPMGGGGDDQPTILAERRCSKTNQLRMANFGPRPLVLLQCA